ncbi:hypothetical protein ASE35_15190 [Lysobacter sp. Root916]|uniref:EF-hand domain-containing protein n=1 Tax=Lysobacter sp. Root916 TaxID=1736606 RepID=UPI00070BFA7D|nr:EF-hand domain-containing protein [Lysobacter sp. Root916]KRD31351.1 hypothetical protein ASE35_15190 [Lysobacter sp. Root916]
MRRPLLPALAPCLLALLPAFAAAQVRSTGDYLSRMDTDGDGKVSLLEYQDWLSYGFDAMDKDRNGVLDPNEFPPGRRGGTALTREQHRAQLAETFRKQDRNRDGSLDARELASPPQ